MKQAVKKAESNLTKLKELQELSALKGGRCLSKEYINSRTELLWQCGKGHTWEATPAIIKQGGWCWACSRNIKKFTIEEIKELARNKGGECLDEVYNHRKTKLTWKCDKGHIWKTSLYVISNGGGWCPTCALDSRKFTIEEMHGIAEDHDGICLSKEYVNQLTKLSWQCKEGHIWETTPAMIKKGTWCPVCMRLRRRLNINDIKQLAIQKGGLCLSDVYTNNHTHLQWQCKKGHTWHATPKEIKRGKWCPICYRLGRKHTT